MSAAPPLGVCTGTVEPGEVFGGFGPASAFAWRGACVGGCGARPMCAAEYPRPECSGCMRARHGVSDVLTSPWRPAVHALGAGFQPVSLPVAQPVAEPVVGRWTVLRPATEVSPHDPSLPRSVRALAELGPAGTRVTLAVAGDAVGGVLASLAVRAPGIGYAVYARDEGGAWGFRNAVAAGRPANVGQFSAALRGEEYVPPPPRAAAAVGDCPKCGAEVSLTKAGAVYASHKCQTRAIEGRSSWPLNRASSFAITKARTPAASAAGGWRASGRRPTPRHASRFNGKWMPGTATRAMQSTATEPRTLLDVRDASCRLRA